MPFNSKECYWILKERNRTEKKWKVMKPKNMNNLNDRKWPCDKAIILISWVFLILFVAYNRLICSHLVKEITDVEFLHK